MSDQEKQAHSMCVTLRLDNATLAGIEDKQEGATLSAALGVRITDTLEVLAKNANKEEINDQM
jgi:hypothetical protein